MILYELQCGQGHRFEVWFKDSAAYDRQAEAGAVACPRCGDLHVVKAPMAPGLVGRAAAPVPAPVERREKEGDPADLREGVRRLETLRRMVEANCDYVADAFPEEARRMHRGEVEARGIYGEATAEDARDLLDEGIRIAPVPWMRKRDH